MSWRPPSKEHQRTGVPKGARRKQRKMRSHDKRKRERRLRERRTAKRDREEEGYRGDVDTR